MLTASPKTLSKYFYEKPDFLTVHNIHLRLIQVEQCVSVSSQLFSISMANCSVNNYMVFFFKSELDSIFVKLIIAIDSRHGFVGAHCT